jgi:predicted DNA-binding transcriptional regulator YafY
MNYLTYSKRMAYLLEIIDKGRLSSPNDLVDQFNCTEKTIRNMIASLREQGYPIRYSKKELKYVLDQK